MQLELNVQNRFIDDTLDAFNMIAEIPGTDRADEIVMLGAHFDSWHAGTGATDNAAGFGRDDGGDAHPEGHRACGCAAPCGWRCGRARSRDCSARAPT